MSKEQDQEQEYHQEQGLFYNFELHASHWMAVVIAFLFNYLWCTNVIDVYELTKLCNYTRCLSMNLYMRSRAQGKMEDEVF